MIIIPDSLISVVIDTVEINLYGFFFAECRNLSRIVIPNNVIYLGDYAFNGCDNLTIYNETAVETQPRQSR